MDGLEIVATEVKTAIDQKLLFCCCNRPPDADLPRMDHFKTYLNCACDLDENIVICGDFNFPKIQWEATESTSRANELLFVEILNDHFLTQLNNTPTRGNNILDLVITNAPDHIGLQEILSPGETAIVTDHHSISLDFNAFVKAPRKFVRNVYDYAKGDFEGLCSALRAKDLTSIKSDTEEDIDTEWECWKKIFFSAVANFIPQKKLKGRNPLPWIDGNILHKIKKKESIRRKMKKDSSGSLERKYKSMRSKVKKLLRERRETYFQSVDGSFKVNPKRFWSVLKRKNKSCSIPNQISAPARLFEGQNSMNNDPSDETSRTTASNPAQIASFFNKYFVSVFTSENLPQEIPNEVNDPIMSDIVITEQEVESFLSTLDTNKATGSDEIPAKLLKETASVITPSLCKLFNKSLQLGKAPRDWKPANVVPVYKKGNKEQTENYRPILERCIFNNIRSHLFQRIHINQHGFLPGKSCVTNLLDRYLGIHWKNPRSRRSSGHDLDMSKAFDRINHQRLLHKLTNSGIGGNLLKWFQSYLTDRRQRVVVIDATSDPLPVCSGVPQGSILGPALFLLYVNNLPDVIKSSQVSMFAGDTKVFSTIRSQDDVKSLQADLVDLEHWSCISGLTFNQSKCKHQRITRKILPVTSSFELGNHLIDTTENEKDLGVWLSSKLTWKKQVYVQTAKANKLLGHISRNTTFIRNTTARRSMYLT